MPAHRTLWWLALDGGTRCPITAGGLLIGRAAHCDLVLSDRAASRDQAIVVAGAKMPSLVVLGRGSTRVRGQVIDRERELRAGDVLELPGVRAIVVCEEAPALVASTSWVLRSRGGSLFGVARTPYVIGGGAGADLRVDGWPEEVLRLVIVDRLHLHAVEPVAIDGREVGPGELEVLRAGAIVSYREEQLEVIAGGPLGAESTSPPLDETPGADAVTLEFLPRGGRLSVRAGGRERVVYLAEKRCELIALLLRPPAPYVAGELVPDDVVVPRLWPGRTTGRTELNVLLHRARHDLARAGLDGPSLLPRASLGSATCFRLRPGATAVVR